MGRQKIGKVNHHTVRQHVLEWIEVMTNHINKQTHFEVYRLKGERISRCNLVEDDDKTTARTLSTSMVKLSIGALDDAEMGARWCLNRDPDFALGMLFLTYLLVDSERFDEASEVFMPFAAMKPFKEVERRLSIKQRLSFEDFFGMTLKECLNVIRQGISPPPATYSFRK